MSADDFDSDGRTATHETLNQLLAATLGCGRALSPRDRARVIRAFQATIKPGQRPRVIYPTVLGTDWAAINSDERQVLVVVNNAVRAYELCAQGQPAVAILGASRGWVRKWMKDHGAIVKNRCDMN